MNDWITKALEEKQILSLPSLADVKGVFCVAREHEWYDDCVVMDWTALHRGLRPSTSSFNPTVAVAEVMRFGCELEGNGSLATALELRTPWCVVPLAEQAQRLSVFLHPSGANVKPYMFCRGPPGQRSVRDDLHSVLQGVQRQLRDSGIRCHVFFGSVIVVSDDFEHLMHLTAAVYRALKSAGIELNANASSFEPRRVFRTAGGLCWNTLSLISLKSVDNMVALLVDLFYMWLGDFYLWLCVTPPESLLGVAGRDEDKMKVFRDFIVKRVVPNCECIEFNGLADVDVEELLTAAKPLLKRKLPLVGPQKWSALELRLCLAALKAYEHPPP